MNLLVQFLMRLVFGLATGMVLTSARQVTSGYYRNHLYVTLGVSTLAALLASSCAPAVFWLIVSAAVASYVGSICWLYEARYLGKIALTVVALAALVAAWSQWLDDTGPDQQRAHIARYAEAREGAGSLELALNMAAVPASGLVVGLALAAMLLGHWYLNSPTMELVPLRRLILALGVAVLLDSLVAGIGLCCEFRSATDYSTTWLLFILLRWAFGLAGVMILAGMAWQTLKIPNTQSATGILYVAVIGTFVGETMALLLSSESPFPL